MSFIKTDQLPGGNQDVPCIIYRKAFTVVTSTSGSGYVEKVSTITAPGIKVGAYNEFDLCVKRTDSSFVYAPIRISTSASADSFWADIWLDSSTMTNADSTATYSYRIRSYGGAVTDTYTCYLVIWSTKINDTIDLFTTTT